MNFELAMPDEAEALAAVHAQAFTSPWSAAEITTLARGPGSILITAREDAEIVAFIMFRTMADEAEVLTLATAPTHRRQGIARRLVDIGAGAAESRGAVRLFLEVAADNAGAIALYEGAGFHCVGRRAGYYSRPNGHTDALVMRRDLNRER